MPLRRLFHRSWSDQSNRIPPITMVGTGLVLIACSLIWPRATAVHGAMSEDGVDFFQGVVGGIGIACEMMGIVSRVRGRKRKNGNRSMIPRA